MITGFRYRGLQRLYERNDRRRIPPEFVEKVERIPTRLDVAAEPRDMNLLGYRLHQLSGDLAGYWAVSVSGNWRIIFRFEGSNAYDVDLVDYHLEAKYANEESAPSRPDHSARLP